MLLLHFYITSRYTFHTYYNIHSTLPAAALHYYTFITQEESSLALGNLMITLLVYSLSLSLSACSSPCCS